MIIKIFLLIILISNTRASIPVILRQDGEYGNLGTSLNQQQCQDYKVSLGNGYSFASLHSDGQATGCSIVNGVTVVYNTDTNGQACSNNIVCVDLGLNPDYYLSADPEATPREDVTWFTQDVACGVGNFVTLTGTDGDWSCKSCNGDGSSTGKELFLEEYTLIRETGTGFLHGKCCINGHHRVCQQLLEYYKDNCDDSDKGHTPNRLCSA